MRLIILAFLLAACAPVMAMNVELSVEYPQTREDGSAFSIEDIAITTVYAGSAVLISADGAPDSITVDLPTCSASHLTGTVTDRDGLESDRSAVLSVLICRPSAPRLAGVRAPPNTR